MKDYYKILGVDRTASEDEIKKTYRRLAHKYHPDRPGGDENKFKEINEAYQVLSNKEKRGQYDRFGTVFEGAAGGPAAGGGFGGFDWNANFGDFADFGGLDDVWDVFFGGQSRKRRAHYRGSDIEAHQWITLEEAMTGKKQKISFNTKVSCDLCQGKGFNPEKGLAKCGICGGRGEIRENQRTFFGNFSRAVACGTCRGLGEIPNESCPRCKGSGRLSGLREVTIEIRPGVEDNQMIKVKGLAEAGERGGEAGDLYVRLRIKSHPVFERAGDDLIIRKEISLLDALLGKKISAPTLRGKTIEVEIPAGFNLKNDLAVKGEGITPKGNLIIRLDIKTPKKLNPKIRKMLEDLENE
jgi:molecular chaperone DnaJ